MFRATYLDALTKRTTRVACFDTEEEFLKDFFSYRNIAPAARDSWKGVTENLMLPEDDSNRSDVVAVDLGRDRWLNIEKVVEE